MTAITKPPTGPPFQLRRGRRPLVVPEGGAGPRSWTVGGPGLPATVDSGAYHAAFAGRVLAPWPNRVRDGRYAFDGDEHRLELSEPERGNALHGLVLRSRWRGVRTSVRRVALSCA